MSIDLDKSNVKEFEGESFNFDEQFKLKLLFEYHARDVDHKSLTNIHARGSSKKEKIDTNNKLVVFLKHEDNLYVWTQLNENTMNLKTFKFVGKFHSKEFMLIDDSKFLYLENFYDEYDKSKVVKQEIKLVTIHYCLYNLTVVYYESDPEYIISFNLD